jgi:hypothetical protein
LSTGAPEHFRCEVRDAGERELLALGEGVADIDGAVVVQADDVAREGSSGGLAVRGHEGERVGDAHLLVEAHVVHAHAAVVLARAQAHERDAVTMLGIHVRLDLEHEAGEFALGGLDLALHGFVFERRRRVRREMRQQFFDSEVRNGRAEEDRGLSAGPVVDDVELGRAARAPARFIIEPHGAIAEEFTPSALCNPWITRLLPRAPRPAASYA